MVYHEQSMVYESKIRSLRHRGAQTSLRSRIDLQRRRGQRGIVVGA